MPSFQIKIDENDLKTVRGMLADIKGAGNRVIVRSINKTLTGVKTDAADELCKVLNFTEKGVKKTFAISKAKQDDISGFFASTGKPVPLIEFIGTRQTNKGVSVQIRKNRPRKVIPGTFITTVKNVIKKTGEESNHTGVFWREWHGIGKIRTKFEVKANRAGWIWSEKKQRFIPTGWMDDIYRFKIKQRFGPRISDYLNGMIMEKVMAKAGQRLKDNIDHETDYELSKHR